MSIIKSLDPAAQFIPTHIDDIAGMQNSMLDLFIFEPFKNIGWIESVRGTSFAGRPNEIPNSAGKTSRIAYWNADEYPDLLQISHDGKELRVFINKIVEGRKQLEHERVAHPGEDIHVDLWESKLVFYSKDTIVDYLASDVDDDGISDLIVVTMAPNGATQMNMLVASDTAKANFDASQIGTSNQSVSQILAYFDYNADGSKDFIFVSVIGELVVLLNLDPVYQPIVIWDQTVSNLQRFYVRDLSTDGRPDFILFDAGKIRLLLNEPTGLRLAEVGTGKDAVMFENDPGTPYNFMVTWSGGVYWISQVFIPHPEAVDASQYIHAWETPDGANFAYEKHIINLEEENQWNRVGAGYDEDEMIIFLQSGSQIYIAWMLTTSSIPYGWNPNFWVYLMGFVIGFSILGGLLHIYLTIKEKEERLRLASIQGLAPNRQKIQRKITV